jgi:UDP-N-acetylmuramoylalanine--D-glutamate ligase
MIRKWFDKKVLILGLSKSGVAVARYLNEKGADCYITEKKALQEKDYELVNELNGLGIKTEFENHSEDFLNDAYIAVTSPGIPPQSEIMQKLKEKNIEVISEIELAYLETQVPFVAITGTNGKTTTTELTNFIFSKEFNSEKCGNIGIPPCSLLLKQDVEFFVCEVSSF